MVIGTRVNLHFDFGAAGNRAVKKSFAWDRRNPDVFGADQYHERNGSRPRWLLPVLVASRQSGGAVPARAKARPKQRLVVVRACRTLSGARQGRPGEQAGRGSRQDVDRRPTTVGAIEVVTLNAWCRQAEGTEIDCPRDLNGRG